MRILTSKNLHAPRTLALSMGLNLDASQANMHYQAPRGASICHYAPDGAATRHVMVYTHQGTPNLRLVARACYFFIYYPFSLFFQKITYLDDINTTPLTSSSGGVHNRIGSVRLDSTRFDLAWPNQFRVNQSGRVVRSDWVVWSGLVRPNGRVLPDPLTRFDPLHGPDHAWFIDKVQFMDRVCSYAILTGQA